MCDFVGPVELESARFIRLNHTQDFMSLNC